MLDFSLSSSSTAHNQVGILVAGLSCGGEIARKHVTFVLEILRMVQKVAHVPGLLLLIAFLVELVLSWLQTLV